MTLTPIQQELSDLATSIRSTVPHSRVEYKTFPSGAGWIDVFLDEHLYQMVYMPSQKLFGVDESLEDDPPFSMYFRYCTPDFEPAAQRLWGLVRGEIKVTVNGAA